MGILPLVNFRWHRVPLFKQWDGCMVVLGPEAHSTYTGTTGHAVRFNGLRLSLVLVRVFETGMDPVSMTTAFPL